MRLPYSRLLAGIEHGVVRIAFIKSVIRALDEDLCPLNQASSQEAGKGAKEYLLKKGGVHPNVESRRGTKGGTV